MLDPEEVDSWQFTFNSQKEKIGLNTEDTEAMEKEKTPAGCPVRGQASATKDCIVPLHLAGELVAELGRSMPRPYKRKSPDLGNRGALFYGNKSTKLSTALSSPSFAK